ncbi:MAG: glycosyltransferase family 4 protein [Patescibacteria group bacterium]
MNIFTVTMTPINPPYDDGAKNIVLGIANHIKNHNFYFISAFTRRFKAGSNISFIFSPFQGVGMHSMAFFQKIYITLIILLRIQKIDILQFFFTPQMYFSKIFGNLVKRYNKKSIQIVSSVHTLFKKNSAEIIPALFFADYTITHSDYTKNLLTVLGVKNVLKVYPGIEFSRFRANPLGRKSNDLTVLYAGTYKILKESYSFEEFYEISRIVCGNIENLKFIMACRIRSKEDRLYEKTFKKLVEKNNLLQHFIFLNTVEDMPSLINNCSVGIMPSRNQMSGVLEIPLVLLELAAMEKPVIYSAIEPFNELADKGLGVCLNDMSAQKYAETILDILKDRNLYDNISRDSKDAVMKHFDIEKTAIEYQKIYADLEKNNYE